MNHHHHHPLQISTYLHSNWRFSVGLPTNEPDSDHQSPPKRRKTSEKSQPTWSILPKDLLESILNRLPLIDALRFRAVCSSWRSIAKTHISSSPFYSSLIQPPWLMLLSPLSNPQNSNRHTHGFRFLNLAEEEFYHLENKKKDFEVSRIVGSSSQWWVVCLDGKKFPFLFNPFLGISIKPSIVYTLPLFRKFVLWSDPILSGNNYGIVAICGVDFHPKTYLSEFGDSVWSFLDDDDVRGDSHCRITFSKCGDSQWSFLDGAHEDYCDIMCCKDYVFALSDMGSVEAWDFSCDFPKKVMEIEGLFPKDRREFENSYPYVYSTQSYLVESLGELLLVIRYVANYVNYEFEYLEGHPCMTKMFHVYELDFKKEQWRKVDSLGDQILFLGGNHSISLSAREFPEYEGNSIYFTGDCWDRMDEYYEYAAHDMGVFNLGDGSITEFFDSQMVKPLPLWVAPISV